MIGISKLYCGAKEASDRLRYKARATPQRPQRPVVVWNITKSCNLSCEHCYAKASGPATACHEGADSNNHFSVKVTEAMGGTGKMGGDTGNTIKAGSDTGGRTGNTGGMDIKGAELSTKDALAVIDDLAAFGVPVLLFSGGEPLLRADLTILLAHAAKKGLRTVISTNGTLITKALADNFAQLGVGYVGVSLDGVGQVHEELRGCKGAFEKTLRGLEFCKSAGLKTGLRFTITASNQHQIKDIFDIAVKKNISRLCFYHLVRTGRAMHSSLLGGSPSHKETRQAMDVILDETRKLFAKGLAKEVLTVDNHADGPYLWLKMLEENPAQAEEVYRLLELNAAASSGIGIACISWNGEVYADQFLREFSFGKVTERPFSQIWTNPETDLLPLLRERKKHVKGRCKECRFLNICAGNFRARAFAETGDIWAADPACYLTDEEIAR